MTHVSLGEICRNISSGGTPSRSNPKYFTSDDSGHLWVKSKELVDVSISTTEERITDEGLENSSAKYYPERTVLIAMYGANVGQLGWLKKRATVNQAICGLVIDENLADPRFMFYSILHSRDRFASLAQGAAQQNLNQDIIRNFEVPFLPLRAQQRVASFLSAYDDLTETNTRRIKILEEMAQMIYREWFVNFRFPGHENVKIVDSEIGPIPDGWKVVKLAALYRTGSGGTPSRKVEEYFGGAIPWVKTKELTDSFIIDTEEKITESGLKHSSAKVFPPRTVLMAMYGATIGKLGMLTTAATCNQACCAISNDREPFGPEYIFLTLKHKRADIVGLRMGAAQQNISQEVIRSIRMLRPRDEVISSFNQLVVVIFDELRVLIQKSINLQSTRDLLLPKLISGEVNVEQVESEVVAQSV
jgi:type I restriction enzyme, S subunit